MISKSQEKLGYLLGALAVSCFAFTLPLSRIAVQGLSPVLVGFGRAFLASMVALVVVFIAKLDKPLKSEIRSLLLAGLGVTLMFPYLSSLAMKSLPASHAAIVTGLLPLATAGWVCWQHHERPSMFFWIAALVGSCAVVGYALIMGAGKVSMSDVLLLACVVFGGMGYAEGAKVAQKRGGFFVMTWALVLMMPILFVIMCFNSRSINLQAPISSWLAFFYLSAISQYGGMIIWYKALSLGSIARLSQVQLLQPFLTVLVAHFIFQETINPLTVLAALIVVGCISLARKSSVSLKSKQVRSAN